MEIAPLRGEINHGAIPGTLEATTLRAEQEEVEEDTEEINMWKAAAPVIVTHILKAFSGSSQLQSCVSPQYSQTHHFSSPQPDICDSSALAYCSHAASYYLPSLLFRQKNTGTSYQWDPQGEGA